MEGKERIAFWVAIVIAATLLLARAGSVPLLDPDESRFARTSVEMLRSGDLVVPRFEDAPRLVKPPLLHWIQSSIFAVLGASSLTARLPAVLASLGSLLLAGWVAGRRFGAEGAFWTVVCLATMPLFLVAGRIGTLDALLAVHVLAAVSLDLAAPEAAGRYRGLAVGGLLGLAFLVKGPVGVLLPLLILLAGRTLSRREVLPSWGGLLQGAAAWCLVTFPWGLALIRRVGLRQMVDVVRVEVLERYFAGTTHVEPPWFYIVVALVGLSPWIAPLVVGIVGAVRRRDDPSARTALYATAGLVAGLIFFSLGKSKLPSYILPLAPLAAIVATWQLGRELEEPRRCTAGSTWIVVTLFAYALLFAVAGARLEDRGPAIAAVAGAVLYGVGGLVALGGRWRRRPRWVYGAAAVSAAVFLLVVATVLFPSVARTRTAAYLVESVPDLASRSVIVVDMKVPSLTYYLDRAPESVDMALFEDRLDAADDPLIVLDESDLPAIPAAAARRLRKVGEQGKYVVFEKAPPAGSR